MSHAALQRPKAAARAATPGHGLRQSRGVTVIELMVAVFIGIMLVVVAIVVAGEQKRVSLRSGTRLMASTIRFAFDRARSTGRDHRLVFDLSATGGTKLSFEVAKKGKQLLPRTVDEAWEQHEKFSSGEEEEEKEKEAETTTIGGLSKNLLQLPRPTGPQWAPFKLPQKEAQLKLMQAAKLVKSIYVARLDKEIEDGKVALHIWRGGFLERAAIYLSDGKDTWTLVTYPLTGRVKIYKGRKDLSPTVIGHDDTGQRIEER